MTNIFIEKLWALIYSVCKIILQRCSQVGDTFRVHPMFIPSSFMVLATIPLFHKYVMGFLTSGCIYRCVDIAVNWCTCCSFLQADYTVCLQFLSSLEIADSVSFICVQATLFCKRIIHFSYKFDNAENSCIVAVILQAEFALDVYVAVNGYTCCRFITGCCSFLQAVMIIA